MIEQIAKAIKEKKVQGIVELRDESSREGLRIFIEVRKDCDPDVLLNRLYIHSDLQCNFGAIMLALDNNMPKIMSLDQILRAYLEFQREVIVRRTQYDLEKAKARLHIVEGLLKALDQIDAVIKTIRSSYNDAKERLMKKFKFTDIQAQAILDLRLQRLQGLEKDKLQKEYNQLKAALEGKNPALIISQGEELKKIQLIQLNINDFMKSVTDRNNPDLNQAIRAVEKRVKESASGL